jgi:hypothetical protein
MADYKIKLEYKGMGKQAGQARQRAVQASQKALDPKIKGSAPAVNKDLISAIQKLTDSNKALEKAVREMSRKSGGGGGGAGGIARGAASGAGDSAAGFGRMGASIPVLGAAIAAVGFSMQKINQVGNAYIDLAGQQLKSTGMGGFRRGRGVYASAEMGAGMAAYSRSTGKSAAGVNIDSSSMKQARDIGALYGMSAEEVMGQSGTFQRAGGDIGRTSSFAAGRGIESEMPILLQGMSGMFEEAIRSGLDSSEMAKDLGKGLTDLAMETPAKSVNAAMAMVQSFRGVQAGVAGGKLGSMEAMYTAQASRDVLMRKLQDPEEVAKLQQSGYIDEEQAAKISKLGPGARYSDLTSAIGMSGAQTLMRKTADETSSPELMKESMKLIQKQYGTGTAAFQKFSQVAAQQGFSQTQPQLLANWKVAAGQELTPEERALVEKKGAASIEAGAKGVEGSAAGIATEKKIRREGFTLEYGAKFAESTIKMEVAMLKMAEKAMPAVERAVDGFGGAITTLTGLVDDLNKKIQSSKGKDGKMSIKKWFWD